MTMGRPTLYSEELAIQICDAVACTPDSLDKICQQNPHFPTEACIRYWITKKDDFFEMYLEAKRKQVLFYAEDTIKIADDTSRDYIVNDKGVEVGNPVAVARDKIKIDTRKWHATRLLPKIFGDRSETKTDVNLNVHEQDLKNLK